MLPRIEERAMIDLSGKLVQAVNEELPGEG
jgi:hypothetical protein